MKNVLILSTSLRKKANSDYLAQAFKDGNIMVKEYYDMENKLADTKMRKSISDIKNVDIQINAGQSDRKFDENIGVDSQIIKTMNEDSQE